MRAVNLLPADARRRATGGGISIGQPGPVHFVLAALLIVLAYVTLFVLTNNTITQRKTQLAALHHQLDEEQVLVARFNAYTKFEQLAQQRDQTVRQIASSRFDWHGALGDLSKVMPAGASLQSLLATVAPGATVSGAGGSTAGSALSTGSLRSAVNAPAFELKGCTSSQDDVARLMSRLRVINGVQRVTLADSVKGGDGPGAATSTAGAAASDGCGINGPSFDMVVFFQPIPGALAVAGATTPGAPAASSAPQSTATSSSTTASSSSTSTTVSAGSSK